MDCRHVHENDALERRFYNAIGKKLWKDGFVLHKPFVFHRRNGEGIEGHAFRFFTKIFDVQISYIPDYMNELFENIFPPETD